MSLFGKPKVLQVYLRLRPAGRELFKKIQSAGVSDPFDILKAAKKLTLPVKGRTLILADEDLDLAVLTDFFYHEFRVGGNRPIDSADLDELPLTPDERDLLGALRVSRTSFSAVTAADPVMALVTLRDLLQPDRPEVLLSDISMSAVPGVAGRNLLFVRLVECQSINMTSGLFFTFSSKLRQRLVSDYHSRMKSVPPGELAQRAFIFFFQRHRECREPQAFADP